MGLFKSAIDSKREELANISRVLSDPNCLAGKVRELRAKTAKLAKEIAQIEQNRNKSVGANF